MNTSALNRAVVEQWGVLEGPIGSKAVKLTVNTTSYPCPYDSVENVRAHDNIFANRVTL